MLKRLFLQALAALALSAPAAAQLAEGEPLVIATTYTVQSDILGSDRKVSVRLPAGYDEQPDMRFPVVYVLDGGPEQDFPHIAGIAQSRDMNWTFDRFILVGIESRERRRYFAPPAADPAPYVEMLGTEPGGTAEYRRFLREEIKPLIDAQFRTSGHDAVMGESLAALFVVETLFEEPTLFDDFIAISPSLWWERMKFGREAEARLAKLPQEDGTRRLYLTVANEGVWHREGMERLVDALRDHAPENLRWTFVPVHESETHGSLYHPMALDAFRTLFPMPTREYKADGLLGGMASAKDSPEELARKDQECTLANSRVTTPGAASQGLDRLYYECLILDLGPTPREGNLAP